MNYKLVVNRATRSYRDIEKFWTVLLQVIEIFHCGLSRVVFPVRSYRCVPLSVNVCSTPHARLERRRVNTHTHTHANTHEESDLVSLTVSWSLRCAAALAGQRVCRCVPQGPLLQVMGLPSRTPAVTQRDPVSDSKDLGWPFTSFSRRGETRSADSRKQVRYLDNLCLRVLSSRVRYRVLCQAQLPTQCIYYITSIYSILSSRH